MKWIDSTPVGRLGFSNYKALLKFCERHGIEVPTIPKRSWQRGVTVDQKDWARLEREQGDRIKELRATETQAHVPVTEIARLFGIRRRRAVSIAKQVAEISKVGRSYVIARESASEVINRVREKLEDAYLRKRTRRFGEGKVENDA